MIALVIPVEGPVEEITLEESSLSQLQGIVGGYIQAIPLPGFIAGSEVATAYVNEEGKFDSACGPNMRATDFMVPGVGLMFGDHIAGSFILCGFNPATGDHAELPQAVIDRARLIEREAA